MAYSTNGSTWNSKSSWMWSPHLTLIFCSKSEFQPESLLTAPDIWLVTLPSPLLYPYPLPGTLLGYPLFTSLLTGLGPSSAATSFFSKSSQLYSNPYSNSSHIHYLLITCCILYPHYMLSNTTTLQSRYCHHPHFIAEKTKSLRVNKLHCSLIRDIISSI